MKKELKKSLTEFKITLDKNISDYFNKEIENQKNLELKDVFENIKEYILGGGKRLRPNILYRMNNEFKQFNDITNILLSFEFLHNSTLIDDDIIDEHSIRRDRFTIPNIYSNRKYNGNYVALLSANILRNKGIDLIITSDLPANFQKECLSAYQNISNSIDSAQILDLEYRYNLNISENEYMFQSELVSAKFIAHMFKLCAPNKYKDKFYEIGKHLGIAFQLSDDLMDVDISKTKGRDLGSDLKEGTPTLLSTYTLEKLNDSDKQKFKSLFGKKNLCSNELNWIIEQYQKTNAIKNTKIQIKKQVDCANEILSNTNIPHNHWIYSFGEYSLQRSN